MTAREAIEILVDGYGDDCPEGGDDYDKALFALAEAGLYDLREGELSSRWPRLPQWAPPRWMFDEYAASLRRMGA